MRGGHLAKIRDGAGAASPVAPYPFQPLPDTCKVPTVDVDGADSLSAVGFQMLTIINLAGNAICCKFPAALLDFYALHWEIYANFSRQEGYLHIWGHLICTLHGWSLETERNV